MRIRTRSFMALGLAGTLLLTACGSDDGGSEGSSGTESEPVTLNIVGFAVPEAANKAIAEEWDKTAEGEGVKFKTSYGASGDQSRAVVAGLKADYVHFSVASDVTRLVDAGLVADDLGRRPDTKGIVSVVDRGVRRPRGQPRRTSRPGTT